MPEEVPAPSAGQSGTGGESDLEDGQAGGSSNLKGGGGGGGGVLPCLALGTRPSWEPQSSEPDSR